MILMHLGEDVLVPDLAGWRRTRLPAYARAGVAHAWLVDPGAETLEVLRLEKGRWLVLATFEGVCEVRAEPFDAVGLELGAVWDRGSLSPAP